MFNCTSPTLARVDGCVPSSCVDCHADDTTTVYLYGRQQAVASGLTVDKCQDKPTDLLIIMSCVGRAIMSSSTALFSNFVGHCVAMIYEMRFGMVHRGLCCGLFIAKCRTW